MKKKEFFEVTSLSRSDLYNEIGQEIADKLTDEEMETLAGVIGESLNNDFWQCMDYALDRCGYERKK